MKISQRVIAYMSGMEVKISQGVLGISLQVRSRGEDISRGISQRSGVEVNVSEGVLV